MKAGFGIAISLLVGSVSVGLAAEAQPENLARKAKASATSEYNDQYRARFAIDGDVPDADWRDDVGRAWCVKGAAAQGKADFTLVSVPRWEKTLGKKRCLPCFTPCCSSPSIFQDDLN